MNGEQATSARTGEPMRCPSCASRLVEFERSGVLIDACPTCRGVWLDRGELDKILVQERQMTAGDLDEDFRREVEGRRPRPEPRYRSDEDDRYYGGHHGGGGGHGRGKRPRRGLLGDLFDFG